VAGLSEAEFRRRFGSEAQCRAALFQLRWGHGWTCPTCAHGRCAELKGRAVYQCNRCKRQVGLTAGTVFHWTKLPLTTWFLAIYHLTQSKGGMSSVELARRLGTRQPTAWLIKHKLMAAMEAREAGKPKLAGRVEVDDAYLGGQRSGGKRGRGAAGKTPFVAAVETTPERKPRRLRLTVVKGFRCYEGGLPGDWWMSNLLHRSQAWPPRPPTITASSILRSSSAARSGWSPRICPGPRSRSCTGSRPAIQRRCSP
jgi:transposase-like protein